MTTAPECCSVLELRQYLTRPGRRDELVDLFDREFVEPQEAVGAHIVGQYRDVDRADRFVWLRGFTDMASRETALREFYGGPVWQRHRDAANATMLDSDDVLLLRPAWAGSGLGHPPPARPDIGGSSPVSAVMIWVVPLDGEPSEGALRRGADEWREQLAAARLDPRAWLRTEPAANTFPALPVREGEWVFVVVAGGRAMPSPAELAALPGPVSGAATGASPQVLRLLPSERAQLR